MDRERTQYFQVEMMWVTQGALRCLKCLVVLLLWLGLAACRGSDTIVLGASLQLTGNLASVGQTYRDAYQFAVERINASGGVALGGFQYKLALKILDNQSNPTLAAQQHADLVKRYQVHFLLGPYTSRDVIAGAAVAEEHQVPMVQGGGSSGQIFATGRRYVFGVLPPAENSFRSTVEMMKQLTPTPKTVGLVFGDDPFDIAVANGTRLFLDEAGLETVVYQQYSERTPNFFNILTLIRSREPDVLLWSGHEQSATNFVRASKTRNIAPNMLWSLTTAVSTASFRSALGKDANFLFGMTSWLPSARHKDRWFGDGSQFAEAFERRFNYAPDYHVAAAVAAVQALIVATEAAGTFEATYVRDALANVDFESLYGRIRFGQNGQISMPHTVIQIQDDRVVEVFTDQIINDPVYPILPWDKRP